MIISRDADCSIELMCNGLGLGFILFLTYILILILCACFGEYGFIPFLRLLNSQR